MIENRWISCPYCGERISVVVDASAGDQEYIEDCQVCCRPIEFRLGVEVGTGMIQLEVMRDDD